MNILYLEDNFRDRGLVERYIQTTLHHLVVASALNEIDLSAHAFDLILLDMYFGGRVNGLDYLRQIRSMGIHCPVIAVTALTLPYQLDSYRDAGIERIVEKPYEITELVDAIGQYAR